MSHPRALLSLRALLVVTVSLLAGMGCDDVPTWQDLTSDEKPKVEGEIPEQVRGEQTNGKAPPPATSPTQPVVKTPQQIVDEFLATETRLRRNAQLEQLAGLDKAVLQQITSLDLQGSQINDLGVPYLAEFPALEELDISRTAVTNDGMQQVARAKGLRKLRLNRMIIDGIGLAALADHQELRELSLSDTPISDAAFQHLSKMDELEVLRVSGTRTLQGHGFDELVKRRVMNNLRELDAGSTGFGFYGLRNLNNVPALEVLIVSDANVSDQMMPGIGSCRNLRRLDVSRNPMGNPGLKALARLNQLEWLNIGQSIGVTDEGLQFLRGHKSLKYLDLSGCRCSPSAVRELKEKYLKNTEIHFDGLVLH